MQLALTAVKQKIFSFMSSGKFLFKLLKVFVTHH